MGEGLECGKTQTALLLGIGEERVVSMDTVDKGKEVVNTVVVPSASGGIGGPEALASGSQEVLGSSVVGDKVVDATSSSTPLRNDLVDADGFQLVVRKGKNVSAGRDQSSNIRIPTTAVSSCLPLNQKSI
ncbi:unnamed protein product [Linum trigynum]|uniref:Uncharacterized protein n=1 Tax=Linum trigynum TaxID=586398 RepID=A0AAV2DUI8_9ROSI